jgi:hypothetical protein
MSASSTPTLGAFGRERQREVDRRRRLADAALARGDGDDVLHAGISFTPRCTECDVIFCVMLTVTRGAPGSAATSSRSACAGSRAASSRDTRAGCRRRRRRADLDLLDGLAADEVLAGVGIDQRAQAGLDVASVMAIGAPS